MMNFSETLRMLTREKEQLADTVKFLESEIKNADNILLEKEKDLNAMKTEKEREVCRCLFCVSGHCKVQTEIKVIVDI